jgi:polar amino acid transport system substrate-binding protein
MKRSSTFILVVLVLAALLVTGCASQSGKLTVVMDATWPPFEYVDEETKELAGFDVDLMKAIAEKEGLEIEFQNVGFDSLLAGLSKCQYDAAISAITITDERKETIAFSDPYFAAGQIVTVRIDNTDITGKDSLVGKVVGAQLGTTGAIELENMEGVTLKTYDDISLVYQDVMNGQIDAAVADNPLAIEYVGKNPDRLKIVGEVFTDEYYGIAVCKTKPELVEKFNHGLESFNGRGRGGPADGQMDCRAVAE